MPAHLSTWAEGHVASLQSLGSGYFGWMSTADRNERCQSHEVYTHHTPENSCSNAFCNKTLATLTCVHVPEKFSYKGIYNNKRNCHCHMSWDRPRCPQQGAGGSGNSGPSPPKKKLAKNTRLTINIVFALVFFTFMLENALLGSGRSHETYRDHQNHGRDLCGDEISSVSLPSCVK